MYGILLRPCVGKKSWRNATINEVYFPRVHSVNTDWKETSDGCVQEAGEKNG